MPVHFNDALDDVMVLDRQSSFMGGQLSFIRGNLLNETQALLLQDVDLETGGVTRTRRGFHEWGALYGLTNSTDVQGCHWFANGTQEWLLAVVAGRLCKLDSVGVWTVVDASAFPSGEPAFFAQINDRIFISVASSKPKYWTAANLAANAAGTAVTDGPATASLLTSQKFRLFARDPAENDSVHVSSYLPTTATPFTTGGVPFYPFRIGEGEGEALTALHAWKGFTLVGFKDASCWIVDTTGVQTPTGVSWTDSTTTADFVVSRVSNRVGCVAERTVASVGNDLLFLSRDGIRSLGKTIEDGDGAVSEALSKPIDDYIERINWESISTACAVEWKGRYLVAVPLDDAITPNAILVFHYRLGAWTVWTGVQPTEFAVTKFLNQPQKLVMLSADGRVHVYRDFIRTSSLVDEDYMDKLNGASATKVPYKILSRSIFWGEPTNPKIPDFLEAEWDHSSAWVDIVVWLDSDYTGKLVQRLDTGTPDLFLPVDLPCQLPSLGVKRDRMSLSQLGACREMVVQISEAEGLNATEASASGPLVMRSLITGAFLDTMPADGLSQAPELEGTEVDDDKIVPPPTVDYSHWCSMPEPPVSSPEPLMSTP